MITFKINGTKYDLPTCWADVTYAQYVKWLKTESSLVNYISLFTGIDKDFLLKAELKNIERMIDALTFMLEPIKLRPEPADLVGPYILPKDVTLTSLGQFEDLRLLLKKLPTSLETKEEQLIVADLYLEACAIYAQKVIHGSYDPALVPKVKEDLKIYPCVDILQTGGFFLSKPLNTSRNTRTLFQSMILHLKKLILALPGYQKTLDRLQRYTKKASA